MFYYNMLMHLDVTKKIKRLRKERGFTTQFMADQLSIDLSAYSRLESGNTLSWSKYLEDILIIFDLRPEEFFSGIDTKVKIKNQSGSYDGNNMHVENLYADDKINVDKMIALYKQTLKEKDTLIEHLYKIIDKLTAKT